LAVAGAVAADYGLNTFVFGTPQAVTPLTTAAIAALVTTPCGYYFIRQREKMKRAQEALSASMAAQEAAVIESQARRQEALAAQAAAEEALARLSKSEELYRLLADNQNDVIALRAADGRRLYASPSAEKAFGYTAEELMSRADTTTSHPEDRHIVRDLVRSLKPGDIRTAEYRLIHKDGSAVWVEGAFRRLSDGSGGILSTTRVITERKQLEQELVAALAEAKAAVAAKSDFLANMTHELRTPLNAIVGFSGLLRASDEMSVRDQRHVALVHDASQTLLGVVNDVLDYSRLEAGAVEFDAHPFDPRELAESTVALMAEQAALKGLTVAVEATGPRTMLLGDGPRLRQVLLNFLSNAIKFTASGGVRVRVTQSPDGDRVRLRVDVDDTGIGVDPDQIGGLFGRFTQADASVSRRFGGTGLGLAISKRIVESHGGQIGARSTPGEGSTFWFEISMPATDAAAASSPGDTPVALEQALRLLVVDDNAVNRELIGALLSAFEVEFVTARDGVEAVEIASRERFDLILMDVQMPNMDGLTATRRIRSEAPAGLPRTPIIAMTANVLPEQVERCLQAGMDGHLGKPIDLQKLLETINRWTAVDAVADAVAQA
jgi:PAS domain S-box-containing protein